MKIVALVSILLLAPVALSAAEAPAPVPAAPDHVDAQLPVQPAEAVPSTDALSSTEVLPSAAVLPSDAPLQWTPAPVPQSLNCAYFSDSYCTYKWNKFAFCCDVVWAAPNAYCPRICE